MKVLKENTEQIHDTIEHMVLGDYDQANGDMFHGDPSNVYGSYEIQKTNDSGDQAWYNVTILNGDGAYDAVYNVHVDKKNIFEKRYNRAMKVC